MSRQRFALVLEAQEKSDGIRSLRHVLKIALRSFRLRCTSAHELHDDTAVVPLPAAVAPAPADLLQGLLVQMPTACRCRNELAVVGPGKAMHAAALLCCGCGKHRGWVSHETHRFLTETVNKFGRPTAPIILRSPSTSPAAGNSTERLHRSDPKRSDPMVTKAQAFPSKWLGAVDVERPIAAEIVEVNQEMVKGRDGLTEPKTVVYFRGIKKPLILNRINFDSIAAISGQDDSEDWPGTRVELYPTVTELAGKATPCIRIRKPAKSTAKPGAKAAKQLEPEPEDDSENPAPADGDESISF